MHPGLSHLRAIFNNRSLKGSSVAGEDEEILQKIEKIVAAMMTARDLVRRGELMEGCEASLDGVRIYVGRYFGPMGSSEPEERSCGAFSRSVPILPYIVSFQVGRMPARKRPRLSIMCTLALGDVLAKCPSGSEERRDLVRDFNLGRRPNSESAEGFRRLELKFAEWNVNMDLYRFTELYYVVLSLPVEKRSVGEDI
jgi:hypothetical protein